MNPVEFESEQVAVIDHYARHGDRYERRITAYPGRFAGLFNWNRGDGFHGDDRTIIGTTLIQQDHCGVKLRIGPMHCFKDFNLATVTIVGIEFYCTISIKDNLD